MFLRWMLLTENATFVELFEGFFVVIDSPDACSFDIASFFSKKGCKDCPKSAWSLHFLDILYKDFRINKWDQD